MPAPCPCQSGHPYATCCAPLHRGEAVAATCEALMRSRYSAFALGGLGDYLLATWAPGRPERRELSAAALSRREAEWTGLEIISSQERGRRGEVEFKAAFLAEGVSHVMHERSRFIREGDHWYYLDGIQNPPAEKVSRNGPCPCGSGKKAKRCCMG
ncbi:YchJ family protein [Larsenimonas rhizosphaerae]|uniref:YchJ family protein n=1 Tax=Larsenimonas rhizosphaerae TaxID=2944682 RepID=A0AA41ZNP8_9GAMM|nr:YchJ family protein [Larsenimonas rhizosphaerae]MCX2524295.1 YchJ family protein [Larsenimonas rhizosphaerae]